MLEEERRSQLCLHRCLAFTSVLSRLSEPPKAPDSPEPDSVATDVSEELPGDSQPTSEVAEAPPAAEEPAEAPAESGQEPEKRQVLVERGGEFFLEPEGASDQKAHSEDEEEDEEEIQEEREVKGGDKEGEEEEESLGERLVVCKGRRCPPGQHQKVLFVFSWRLCRAQ